MTETVLVTGASRGIGRGIALSIAGRGFDVVVHYGSNKAAALATAEQVRSIGAGARLLRFDVSNRDETLAAKPTRDLDGAWAGGFMKPDDFVAIVYESLAGS